MIERKSNLDDEPNVVPVNRRSRNADPVKSTIVLKNDPYNLTIEGGRDSIEFCSWANNEKTQSSTEFPLDNLACEGKYR